MANPEHLAIVKRGVEAWNEWRKQNPKITPDLRRVDLMGAYLLKADLDRADLSEAYLIEAYLSEAHLNGANLRGVHLDGANLRWTYLNEADLRGAQLRETDLREAYLRGAYLRGAHLKQAHLNGAHLNGADLHGADLREADLRGAHLSEADLQRANLQYGQLSRCDLTGAKLTGTKFYATARDGWIINGVECRYVFLDIEGKVRSPKDRDLAPGEFEQLYRSLPTIEYFFQHGMTPLDLLIMDRVVQVIRDRNRDYDIQIDSISAGGLAPFIKFTVQKEEQKEAALIEVTKVYEAKVHDLAGRLDEARSFFQRLIG